MNIGDTVFVRWYGKILEGMIVENSEVNPLLASMIIVRVPVQGVRTSALFTPDHVYPTAELAGMKEHIKVVPMVEASKVTHEVTHPSEAWKRLQEFKKANWDEERNHIKLTALNDFYELWRQSVAEKMGYRDYPKHPYVPEFNGWHPVEPKPVAPIIDNAIKEIKKAQVTIKKNIPAAPKLSKKQLKSTGEINYGDVTQLSIF